MLPTVYRVTKIGNGTLSIMARPVSGEWIEDEFRGLQALGIDKLVSLLEPMEEAELGLNDERSLCTKYEIAFDSFPIPDRGLPDMDKARSLVAKLHEEITQGIHAVIHCRAGIGRTGIIAGALLKHAGYNASTAIQLVSKARGVQIPDTIEQEQWLENYNRV